MLSGHLLRGNLATVDLVPYIGVYKEKWTKLIVEVQL